MSFNFILAWMKNYSPTLAKTVNIPSPSISVFSIQWGQYMPITLRVNSSFQERPPQQNHLLQWVENRAKRRLATIWIKTDRLDSAIWFWIDTDLNRHDIARMRHDNVGVLSWEMQQSGGEILREYNNERITTQKIDFFPWLQLKNTNLITMGIARKDAWNYNYKGF